MTTAKAVLALREQLGDTQAEFAERLGSTITTVSRYENGRNEPNRTVLKKLALIAKDAGLESLKGFFDSKRRATIEVRIKKAQAIAAGSERPVSLDDLESWRNYLRDSVSNVCEDWIDTPKSSDVPAELSADLRGIRGTSDWLIDEIELYIGSNDKGTKPE